MRHSWVLAMLAMPAAAQEHPRVQPSRDVVVDYRVEGAAAEVVPGGAPGRLRLSWDAAGQRLRAEAEGRTQALLADLRGHTAMMVDSALHTAITLPVRGGDIQALSLEGARLTRRGTVAVAGLGCTEYDVQASRGTGTVCLTPDGVALRGRGVVNGRSGSFMAESVSYGALPPMLFQPPPGTMQLRIPGLERLR